VHAAGNKRNADLVVKLISFIKIFLLHLVSDIALVAIGAYPLCLASSNDIETRDDYP